MKKRKRILAWMLTLAMLVSAMPIQALVAKGEMGTETVIESPIVEKVEDEVIVTTQENEIEPTAEVPVAEPVIYYTATDGTRTEVNASITLPISDRGTFRVEGYANDTDLIHPIEWKNTKISVPSGNTVSVGLYSGKFYCTGAGEISVKVSDNETSQVLKVFTINAVSPTITDMALFIDDIEINESFTVAGYQNKKIIAKGKYAGKDIMEEIPTAMLTYTALSPVVFAQGTSMASTFTFSSPAEDIDITVSLKDNTNVKKTFKATSTYVPIESVISYMPTSFAMHERNPFTGNFIGVQGGYDVIPSNASYRSSGTWTSDDPTAANFEMFNNGFVPYKKGRVGIKITCIDKGVSGTEAKAIVGTSAVDFSYRHPVTTVTISNPVVNIVEGNSQVLDLKFEPSSPSEPGMKWEFSTPGIVNISQDTAILSQYTLTANIAGSVEVTGKTLDDTNGVKTVKFTVNISESSTPVIDVIAQANKGIGIAKKFWTKSGNGDNIYKYGSEWDVFSQTRSGQIINEDKVNAYITSVVDTYKGTTTASETKPTTLARVALTLSALGKDANSIDGLDFINMMCNHINLDGTSNDPAWVLIALDSKNYTVPSNARWDREKLISALLEYQNADGGFSLSKNAASGVDITAMAIQALSNYQNRADIKNATDKALSYLKKQQSPTGGFQDSGAYNCESVSQVIIALTSLGLDATDPANGFVQGKNRNLITNIMSFSAWYAGFGHTEAEAKNDKATAMPSQQALISLDSYIRAYEGRNRVYDMNDIESPGNVLPQIDVVGIKDNEIVKIGLLKLNVSAPDCTQVLRLNNVVEQGKNGVYDLILKSGVNSIVINVTHTNGKKNTKTIKFTFQSQDYSKDIIALKTTLNGVMNGKYDYKTYSSMASLAVFYQNRTGVQTPFYYKDIIKNIDKIKTHTVNEWANTIYAIIAMGGDPENVNGVNLLKSLDGISNVKKVWSFEDATEILNVLNTKNYNILYENQSSLRGKLVATVLSGKKSNGGFGASNTANPLDTAKALQALRIGGNSEIISGAITYLANNQSSYTGINLDKLSTLSAVLNALSNNGIDISLDYRFSQENNIFTNIKAIVSNAQLMQFCPEIDIIHTALAINAFERINKNLDPLMDMSNIAPQYGMMATDKELIDAAKNQILRDISFDTYSDDATVAMALMLKAGVPMPKADSYLALLKTTIVSDSMQTAKKYFNAIMLIDALGQNPENFDGINIIEKLFNLNMVSSDEWIFALMALNIGDYTIPNSCQWTADLLKAKVASAYDKTGISTPVPTGAIKADNGIFASISYISTINSLAGLSTYKMESDVYIDKTIEYIASKWDSTKLGSGDFNFSEVRAQMIIGLAFANIDVRTDINFIKANQSIMTLITDCFVKKENNYGFSISNTSNELNTQSALAIYAALTSLERIDAEKPHIYAKNAQIATDFAGLRTKVAEAKAIAQAKYTVASYNVLKTAIEKAELILANASTIQNTVNVQVELIQQAITSLIPIGQPPVTAQEARLSIDAITIGEGYFINGQTITINSGDSVYDILANALGSENLKTTGSGASTYISSMKLNGKWLGEFDNGPLSGWMYSVNGKFPDISCGAYDVQNGDIIRWRYTKNLGVDVGDNSTNAGSSDKLPDVAIPPVSVPVIIDKNGQANAKMTTEIATKLAETIKNSGDKAGSVVNVTTTLPKNASGVSFELPKAIIAAFVATKNTALQVSSELGALTLEAKAIAEIGKVAKGKDIAISMKQIPETSIESFKGRPIYNLEITVGDEKITSFGGGKINVSIPYTLLDGEDISKLTVYYLADDGTSTKMVGAKYNAQLKTMNFSTNHFSTFAIVYDNKETVKFTDITDDYWANEYIYYLANLDIITGKTASEFYPESSITRAEFITMLARLYGNTKTIITSTFSDVEPNAWYGEAVDWASQNKIVTGISQNIFSPNAEITRQDMAVMMENYTKHMNAKLPAVGTPSPFADESSISIYAQYAMKHLQEAGIISGNKQNLANPQSQATRAEAAAMLARLIQAMKSK